jgi:hypothetical protein
VAQAIHLWQFTGPMRLRSKLTAVLLLALALQPGRSVHAQEKKGSTPPKKPAATKPAAPAKKPAPAKPQAPPKSPAAGGGSAPGPRAAGADANRSKALVRAITAQEKSEKAGEVFRQFMEGTTEERAKLVADPAKNAAEVIKYFSESPNRDFKPISIQILGTVTSPSVPDRMFFPYFVATDKNPLGFVTVVVETPEGFRVDWTSFVRGHDLNLEQFFTEKKPGSSISALLGISRSHMFGGEGPPGGENKFHTFAIEMPPPPITQDAPKAFVEKDSETGKLLGSKLGWTRGHLCWLTVGWEAGTPPVLKIKAYQPYAK